MGRLSGMSASDVIHKLRAAGFVFDRMARGSHEVWRNATTGFRVIVPNHPGDMPEGTVRAIVRGSGISVEEFLRL
ncbi:MAG: type II toxin-antitoxin system HicA family toxin [Armatimonadota bacterium]|nr:type II toxin-antitoxin system HicA family toxin [Armatimonadota bacterium]